MKTLTFKSSWMFSGIFAVSTQLRANILFFFLVSVVFTSLFPRSHEKGSGFSFIPLVLIAFFVCLSGCAHFGKAMFQNGWQGVSPCWSQPFLVAYLKLGHHRNQREEAKRTSGVVPRIRSQMPCHEAFPHTNVEFCKTWWVCGNIPW